MPKDSKDRRNHRKWGRTPRSHKQPPSVSGRRSGLHAEAPAPVLRGVHVVERKHGAHPPVGARPKAALAVKFARVAEGAEQHVPYREVGKVVVVKTQTVV